MLKVPHLSDADCVSVIIDVASADRSVKKAEEYIRLLVKLL